MEEVDDYSTLESSTVLQDDDMKTSTCACDVLERGQNPRLEEEHTSQANAILTKCVTCESTKELMKIPTVILTILQAAPVALPFGFVSTFFNDFLQEVSKVCMQYVISHSLFSI